MTLSQRLAELVKACFSAIWLQSYEHEDAIAEIARLCHQENWRMVVWDIDQGISAQGTHDATDSDPNAVDPLAAVRTASAMATDEVPSLLVLTNFHRFLGSAEIAQAIAHQAAIGKRNRVVMIVLSSIVDIPVELEKMFTIVEHSLPSRDQLREIAEGVGTEEGELPSGGGMETVLEAASGLTRTEAENAFALGLVREGRIAPETIWELKAGMLKKSGLLQLYHGEEDFGALGGLDGLKSFCKRSLIQSHGEDLLKRPRGVLLLGVSGTGKSQFAKSLGKETRRPTLVLDIGSLMGSLVGQTEQNVRQALRITDMMSPCILFIDELEKGLGGVAGGGQNDSGVSSRMFGTLLSWMNDRTSNVYIIATCNDISRLPPELTRAERFDAIMFLDLPGRKQKDLIWDQYLGMFGLDRDQRLPDDDQWTGAEVRCACRLAALLDLPLVQAAQNVIPVARTAGESVESLRSWASGRCIDAERGGIYRHKSSNSRQRRSVSHSKPSAN